MAKSAEKTKENNKAEQKSFRRKVDPSLLKDVGDALVSGRNKKKKSSEDISSTLCIRKVYVHALEKGDYAALPEPCYTLGFVRSYAEYVGIDPEPLVQTYKDYIKSMSRPEQAAEDLHFPKPTQPNRIPNMVLVALSVGLVILAYAGWYAVSSQEAVEQQGMQPAGVEQTVDDESPAEKVMNEEAEEAINPTEEEAAAEDESGAAMEDQSAAPEATSTPAVTTATETTAATPAASAMETAATPAAAAVETPAPAVRLPQVTIKVKDTSWIQIKKVGVDKPIISRVYQTGEEIKVPQQRNLELVTSNAGGVEIQVDGKSLPSIGPAGAIRRGVSLDPVELKKRL